MRARNNPLPDSRGAPVTPGPPLSDPMRAFPSRRGPLPAFLGRIPVTPRTTFFVPGRCPRRAGTPFWRSRRASPSRRDPLLAWVEGVPVTPGSCFQEAETRFRHAGTPVPHRGKALRRDEGAFQRWRRGLRRAGTPVWGCRLDMVWFSCQNTNKAGMSCLGPRCRVR